LNPPLSPSGNGWRPRHTWRPGKTRTCATGSRKSIRVIGPLLCALCLPIPLLTSSIGAPWPLG
jgi:hypothetical protein